MPTATQHRLMCLSEVLGKRVHASNEILKRLFFGKILLTPKSEGKRKGYLPSGEINLYGLVKPASSSSRLNGHEIVMPSVKFEVEVGLKPK